MSRLGFEYTFFHTEANAQPIALWWPVQKHNAAFLLLGHTEYDMPETILLTVTCLSSPVSEAVQV